MSMILALDAAGACGWARGSHVDGIIDSGVWDLRPEKGKPVGQRYQKLRDRIVALEDDAPIDLIIMEQAHHRGGPPTRYAYGYLATVELWAIENGAEVDTAHSRVIKKFFTGKGNASKDLMVATGRDLWGGELTHDEVDARAILTWALER